MITETSALKNGRSHPCIIKKSNDGKPELLSADNWMSNQENDYECVQQKTCEMFI